MVRSHILIFCYLGVNGNTRLFCYDKMISIPLNDEDIIEIINKELEKEMSNDELAKQFMKTR